MSQLGYKIYLDNLKKNIARMGLITNEKELHSSHSH